MNQTSRITQSMTMAQESHAADSAIPMSKLAHLRDVLGFDVSYHIPFTKAYHVGCSQCAAVAINGVACHETGCPHATKECKGCNVRVPMNVSYCGECDK